jgi:Domain of unknown function (DUF4402)
MWYRKQQGGESKVTPSGLGIDSKFQAGGCRVTRDVFPSTFSRKSLTMSYSFKQIARQVAVASGLVTLGMSAYAAQGSTATASASATIVSPIAITKTSDLVFGKLAVGAVGGNVAISTANVVSISGAGTTVSQPAGSTGNPAAAVFGVTGEAGFTYAITLPTDGAVTISDGASHTMAVNGFVSNPGTSGTLSGAGTDTLKVGATLVVGNNQVAGTYTGTFNVTVSYN